jgi:uncharacterized radical SAM superfamily protein
MNTITFVYPSKTAVISVTGKSCGLNCRHCQAKYLQHMDSIDNFNKDVKSILLSGGFDKNGSVPITEEHLKQLKKYKLNIHSGLVDEKQAKLLGKYAHSISFDFPAGNDVIKKVYNLNKTMNDYIKAYKLLKIHCENVVPHICVGLGGNELRTINLIAKTGFDELVLLALMPNEFFKNPPSIEKLIGIMKKIRHLYPGKTLALGCMRPSGDYRKELDIKALEHVDKIVMPHKDAVESAKKNKFKIKETHECCVL